MKNLIVVFLITFLGTQIWAQECSPYFNYTEGQTFELTNYDKKDKVVGFVFHEVVSVSPSAAGGFEAIFKSQIKDKEGMEINTGEYAIICEDGIYKVDIGNMINQDLLKSYQSMDLEVEGNSFELPKNLSSGQELDDVEAKIYISSGGTKLFTMTINITERKVEGFETIKTPAGEFECVALSYVTQSKLGFVKTKIMAKDYFAKGVGLVKSESFNKKGKKQSTSVLTKWKK
jgi:hypothetical protein